MKPLGEIAVLLGGRAGLGTAERLVRAGVQNRPGGSAVVGCGV